MVAPRGYKGCGIATSTTYSAIHACAIVQLRVPSERNKRRSGPKSEDHAYFKTARRISDKHVVKRSWSLFWQSLALATTEDVAHVGCRPASFIWFRE